MSDNGFFAEELYDKGYADIVSVIPPGAQLVPSSKIVQAQVGKVPGRKTANGLWAGYDWRRHEPTIEDVRQWSVDGASIGLRADYRPAVDIDCAEPGLAQIIEDYAQAELGAAPCRVGRAPKRLLMYRCDEPFGRMRLWIKTATGDHLVEVLGQGQQFLVHGIHPGTARPYTWDQPLPRAYELATITREQADKFVSGLGEMLELSGIGTCKREGDGKPITHAAASDQIALRAPSIEVLSDAVSVIPNTTELFPDRTSYLRMGYAIKAAAGDDDEAGFEIYAAWCSRWDEGGNDPETVRADWRRMTGGKAVGWAWIAEQARPFGFNDAALDFDAVEDAPPDDLLDIAAINLSDQWLADRVATSISGVLRFIPETGRYLAWRNNTWTRDGELLAEDLIKRELRKIADFVVRHGGTDKEKKEAEQVAKGICSATALNSTIKLLRSERSIAVSLSALDHDPWLLNTPAGMVDLKTGTLLPPDPDALCTKSTTVPPDFNGSAATFLRFLHEATGGDDELVAYLQRLAGYALTGVTSEQHLTFIYGEGGTGKSTFLKALGGVMGDYAAVAEMNTFTASRADKHTTEIAMLVGARLVTASETEAGKRWDEARLKSLTGGDRITARFLYKDNFTFTPQFKLVFIGNHKPEIRSVERAMQRRIQMMSFNHRPATEDKLLDAKLEAEYPAILAWMIEGCLKWQKEGLAPPAAVRKTTNEYFHDEDSVGRWLDERCTMDGNELTDTSELYGSYREWASENGEYASTLKRLSLALESKGYARLKHPVSRRACVKGIKVINRLGEEFNTTT
jgi:putative DNA primase/helicase